MTKSIAISLSVFVARSVLDRICEFLYSVIRPGLQNSSGGSAEDASLSAPDLQRTTNFSHFWVNILEGQPISQSSCCPSVDMSFGTL